MDQRTEKVLLRIDKLEKHICMLHDQMKDLCSNKSKKEREFEQYLKQFQNSDIISPYAAFTFDIKKSSKVDKNIKEQESIGSLMLKNILEKEAKQRNNFDNTTKNIIRKNIHNAKDDDYTDKWTTTDMIHFKNILIDMKEF